MVTLVSPGVGITIIDESQYSSPGQGTIPLFVLVTGANKLNPDGTSFAVGTQESNVLRLITSQRELSQVYGVPFFETLSGSVVQGSEINEYGLHAAYSYLGIANRAYVLRADVDLTQLKYTQTAPTSTPANGTYWFDLTSTRFGIFRSNGSATPGLAWDVVSVKIPVAAEVDVGFVPLTTFGVNGDIAVVTLTTNNRVYEKIAGTWYQIGSTAWKAQRDTVALGTVVNPTFTIGNTLIINGTTITLTGTTATQAATDITTDSAMIAANITATVVTNRLQITHGGGLDLTIAGSARVTAGLNADYAGYHLVYSSHTSVPVGAHSGDIWIKTTTPNSGANYVVKRFSTSTGQFASAAAPFYIDDAAATTGYGSARTIGSLYVSYNTTGTLQNPVASQVIKRWDGSAWTVLTYQPKTTAPTTEAANGTLWISDALRADIMVNDGDEWKGYRTSFVTSDPAGVQITSLEPTEQSDGTPLVDNDLWIDSNDTINYPALYRWNASLGSWVLIDKTDQTTPFGIVFADARPNADGKSNGSELIADMLVSSYVDPFTPDPRTYPAGTLLFNTSYSSYNVKKWTKAYLPAESYNVGITAFPAPTYLDRFVTESGNKSDGSPFMGRFAQHAVAVKELQAVVASNDDVRSESNFFNLMTCPGYPELDNELQGLNIDRKETAFIIADLPLRLNPSATSLQNWATNAAETTGTDEFGRTTRYTYSAEYYPHGLSTDTNGNNVVVPSSTLAIRQYAYNDSVAYPWMSPAGTQRGVIQNASSVGYITAEEEYKTVSLNKGQSDVLYLNNINPIVFSSNRGFYINGDKSLHPETSALDRVNVARLICYLRYQLDQLAQPFLFQLNVESTRQSVESAFKRYLGDLLSVGALVDFAVQCDRNNNSNERIDRNELWIDLAIVPPKSINFIYIPLRIKNTGSI